MAQTPNLDEALALFREGSRILTELGIEHYYYWQKGGNLRGSWLCYVNQPSNVVGHIGEDLSFQVNAITKGIRQ